MIRFGDVRIDRATNTIWHGQRWRRWFDCKYKDKDRESGASFRLLAHLLMTPGENADQLFDVVYGHNANGGPDYGVDIIRVMISHLKPDLEKLNLELRTSRHNSRTLYKVVTK